MKILAIGAHFDDIELNALGTILRAKKQRQEVSLVVCTNSGGSGSQEDRKKEQEAVNHEIGYKYVYYLTYEDGKLMPLSDLVTDLEAIINEVNPDIVITHSEDDFHQDHSAVAKAVRAVNRYSNFSVITFASQDIKQPFEANLYVDISDYFEKKLEILKIYSSQEHKPWLDEDIIKARNAGVGGIKYAEKFDIKFLKI